MEHLLFNYFYEELVLAVQNEEICAIVFIGKIRKMTRRPRNGLEQNPGFGATRRIPCSKFYLADVQAQNDRNIDTAK